jgi:phosphoribosylformimino-5-aminoimidazole carboxamide ribotide isomerase
VLVIPSIDLEGGRSRVVYWPGASTGIGAPTDRPERIVERVVAQGARLVHLVDFDGARAGSPGNLDAVGAIASRSAVPLQLAGGLDSPEAIQLAFAAGATRVVLTTAVADRPDDLRACLAIAGDWLAVGVDPRPERLAAFPWRRTDPPTVEGLFGELVGAGVTRFVLAHGGTQPDLERVRSLVRTYNDDAEILVAGGVRDLDGLRRLRETGAAGVILGEALLSGVIDLPAALEAAA